MKKLFIISALFISSGFLNAAPGKGGYLGERFIIGTEFSYSPFYTSVKDFFTKYNFQYGGNINVIVGRRTQIGVDYNLYSLGHNEVYNSFDYVASDRIKGSEIGLTLRTFNSAKGGIAPIGKFFDFGLGYSRNEFIAGSDNPNVIYNPDLFKMTSNQLTAHVAFGSQMVFWNHLVANTGVRIGSPLFEISGTGNSHYLVSRNINKDIFSVFFGLGVLF